MKFGMLDYRVEDGIATITLNRPPANAIDAAMAYELMHAAILADEDPTVRAALIAAEGKMFSGGGDLKAFAAAGEKLPHLLKEITTYLHAAVSRLARSRVPVITAVNGSAAGAGLSLVFAADLVLAGESATFHYAYSKVGLSPDGSSTYFLPRILGMRQALEFALTSRSLSADEAREYGIVTGVVGDAELKDKATRLASDMATGPTESFASTKRLFHRAWTETLETQMEIETRALADTARTADAREGIHAFLEKRPGQFTGS